ncbi:MAG: hypothetical protein WBB28_24465 [Crinalium sp.]
MHRYMVEVDQNEIEKCESVANLCDRREAHSENLPQLLAVHQL